MLALFPIKTINALNKLLAKILHFFFKSQTLTLFQSCYADNKIYCYKTQQCIELHTTDNFMWLFCPTGYE